MPKINVFNHYFLPALSRHFPHAHAHLKNNSWPKLKFASHRQNVIIVVSQLLFNLDSI